MRRERASKIVLVVVGLLFCAGVYPLILMAKQALRWRSRPCAGDDDESIRHARHLPAACVPQSLCASQPDRLRGVVELRARQYHGSASISWIHCSQRTDRFGFVRRYRCNPDRAGSSKRVTRASIRSHGESVEGVRMPDTVVESLILDLLQWLAAADRSYEEVMEAWRTSCPKLPVWEEANDRADVGDLDKNATFIGLLLAQAWEDGTKFPTLERLCKSILEFAASHHSILRVLQTLSEENAGSSASVKTLQVAADQSPP